MYTDWRFLLPYNLSGAGIKEHYDRMLEESLKTNEYSFQGWTIILYEALHVLNDRSQTGCPAPLSTLTHSWPTPMWLQIYMQETTLIPSWGGETNLLYCQPARLYNPEIMISVGPGIFSLNPAGGLA